MENMNQPLSWVSDFIPGRLIRHGLVCPVSWTMTIYYQEWNGIHP
jgi:hypothetical protein